MLSGGAGSPVLLRAVPLSHLEEVELVVVEDAVVVQVRHFEDASQGFDTEGLHLGHSQTAVNASSF